MDSFKIAQHDIGRGAGCFVIGEVAQAHDGSLGMAHAFIDAIAATGAHAVKFQTHLATAESSPEEPWRVKFSRQDASRYDYWRRMEFSADQWRGLRDHARDAGLVFLSSPFSVEAVTLLDRLEMPAWKVASGEVNNPLLLEVMSRTGKPAMISSGMSTWEELDAAVARFREQNCPVALLQCTTAYPCPPERIGLDVLEQLRQRYNAPVGLSDHSGTIYAAIAAATMGASLIELHVTMSREMFGPDVPASVTTSELRQVVEGVRFVHRALSSRTNKDQQAQEMQPLRAAFGKSLVARRALPAGTILRKEDLTAKKPGRGIPASEFQSVVGKRVCRALSADEFLRLDDFAGAG